MKVCSPLPVSSFVSVWCNVRVNQGGRGDDVIGNQDGEIRGAFVIVVTQSMDKL